MTTNNNPPQPAERKTTCGNCGIGLYQTANPNDIHWYHAGTGDVRCPTRFAQPVARPADVAGAPERIWLPADTDDDTWNILAKNPSRNWKTGEPANNIEYVRATQPATTPSDHPEDYCHKCGGPNVVWFAPNPVWKKAVSEAGEPGILCPTCFIQLAEQQDSTECGKLPFTSN